MKGYLEKQREGERREKERSTWPEYSIYLRENVLLKHTSLQNGYMPIRRKSLFMFGGCVSSFSFATIPCQIQSAEEKRL